MFELSNFSNHYKDYDKNLWQLKYIYKKIRYQPNKKYVKQKTKYPIIGRI